MEILFILISVSAVFVFFRITRILLKRFGQRYAMLKKLTRAYPVIEVIVWAVIIFWATSVLFGERVYYPYIVTAMAVITLALATWFYFRDVVAGMVFRSQNDLVPGDNIQVGPISGHLKSIHLTYVEVVSDNGSTIKIPNSRLSQELISASSTPEGLEEFKIRLAVDRQLPKPEIEEMIRKEVANSPWCDYKNPPVIKLKDETDRTYFFDVMVYNMNRKHHSIIEKALKNRFGVG